MDPEPSTMPQAHDQAAAAAAALQACKIAQAKVIISIFGTIFITFAVIFLCIAVPLAFWLMLTINRDPTIPKRMRDQAKVRAGVRRAEREMGHQWTRGVFVQVRVGEREWAVVLGE